MEQDRNRGIPFIYNYPGAGHASRNWGLNPICALCHEETKGPISIPCGHTFCLTCYNEYQESKGKFGYRCPSCINEEVPKPLQLVSVDANGLLVLQESALHKCFLGRRIEEYPVYLISVIGEKRSGKSFLMNYIMKALQSQEAGGIMDLGEEDEILKGFPWKPGTEKVTNGIWIWSKPFILEKNGQKVAVFLLDTEGSMDMEGERKANIKMCMLTMLLSSHLVYNVNNNIKESDIDYLEIYCNGIGCEKLLNLKYFDFLIRNWFNAENCGADEAELYINMETEIMKKRYKNCTFLDVLNQCSSKCFLMPYPGDEITSKSEGRLKDMKKSFQDSLRAYLSGILERVPLSTDFADSKNTFTCSEMFQMITVLLSYINDLKYNISNPSEMYNMKKNQENMQEIQNEFQEFLSNWSFWNVRIGDQVEKKISELEQKFANSFMYINEEDRNEQMKKLKTHLVKEGDKFCRRHNFKLLLHGVPALLSLGLAAAPVAGGLFVAEVAAPAVAPVILGSTTLAAVVSGATGVVQAVLGFLR